MACPPRYAPDPEMLTPVRRIVCFMETRDRTVLASVFARGNSIVLLDSFFPYVFQGLNAAERWADGFIAHASNLTDLRHTLGGVYEFSRTGDTLFFSQTVIWEGKTDGIVFHETGGLALVLVMEDGVWRVRTYGWAVTSFTSAREI